MSDFVVWKYKDEGNSCALDDIQGVERVWELSEGVSRAADFPAEASFAMSPKHKKSINLTDNLFNTDGLIVASQGLKEFLEAGEAKNLEYLKVKIFNHKGRVASDEYYIVNMIEPQDALDIEKSEPRYSSIVPGDIVEVQSLVVDPDRVDPEVGLFRLKNFGAPIIVRRQLAEAMVERGFRGVTWVELDRFGK